MYCNVKVALACNVSVAWTTTVPSDTSSSAYLSLSCSLITTIIIIIVIIIIDISNVFLQDFEFLRLEQKGRIWFKSPSEAFHSGGGCKKNKVDDGVTIFSNSQRLLTNQNLFHILLENSYFFQRFHILLRIF